MPRVRLPRLGHRYLLLVPALLLCAALARAGAGVPTGPEVAARLQRQREVAFAIKRDGIWAGARNHFRQARERAELVRRARRGDRAAMRGLRVRRAGEDEGPVVREPLPAGARDRAEPARLLGGVPTNVRCNDPTGDAPNAGQSEASIAALGNQVVVAWNDGQGFNVVNGDIQGYGWSADGGTTFTDGGTPLRPAAYPAFRWTSDPVMTVNERTGDFFYCGLASPDAAHNAIAVARGRFAGGVFAFDSVFVVRLGLSASVFLDKPWLTCDSSTGNLYVTCTAFGAANAIDLQRSTDGGRTWSAPLSLSSAADAGNVQGSRVAVGPLGEVMVAWYAIDAVTVEDDLRVRRSGDRGLTFGAEVTPAKFNSQFGTGAPGFNRERGVNFPSLAVDRSTGAYRGRTYLAWPECWRFLATALPPAGATDKSEAEDNGSAVAATAFTPGQTLRGTLAPTGGVTDQDWWCVALAAGQSVVVWADSVTLGAWYLRLLAPDGVQRLCYGGNPGASGSNYAYYSFTAPVSGTYYLRMLEVNPITIGYRIRTAPGAPGSERGRDQRDVFAAWSDDGAAWSAPVRVNDDAAGYDQFLPELAVGTDGAVYAMWYDHRDQQHGSKASIDLSRSTDGGATWAASQIVTSLQSNFTTSGTNIAPNMGDYCQLACAGSALHPVWSDGRSTTSVDVWSAAIALSARIASRPADTTMSAPGTATFGWTLTGDNPLFAGTYGVSLGSDRAWPLPGGASVTLGTGSGPLPNGAAASTWWSADVTVPDSAASGDNRICLTLTSPAGVVMARSCFTVHALGTPLGVGPGGTRALALAASRPNPAFGSARIAYTVPRAGRVRLALYDLAGARVRTLVDGPQAAGGASITWDGRDDRGRPAQPGAYFYRLEFEGRSLSRRLVLMR